YLLMALPFLIFVFAFSYVPLFGWYYSFTDYKVGQLFTSAEFVGLKHFNKLLHDTDVIRVLRNTLVMSGLNILTSPLPVAFAIMLSEMRGRRSKKIVQTVTTLPNFISWIVVFGVAYSIFSSNGLWNQVMEVLHLQKSQAGLIGDGNHVWGFQLMLLIWKSLGWNSIIYLAAITGIDTELYDAAKVDGANKIQLIRHITIPGIMPTFLVLLLLNVGNILSNGFEQYYIFWNTFTADKIEVLDYYVYKLAFRAGQYSYSIAIGMVKSIVSVGLLALVNWISKKVRGYSLI
ncbi:MAG: ABC transporter permease, partial [Oliverpabstia sp.]